MPGAGDGPRAALGRRPGPAARRCLRRSCEREDQHEVGDKRPTLRLEMLAMTAPGPSRATGRRAQLLRRGQWDALGEMENVVGIPFCLDSF